MELLKKPKEYVVKFTFPSPPPLNPPILGLKSKYTLLVKRQTDRQTGRQLMNCVALA